MWISSLPQPSTAMKAFIEEGRFMKEVFEPGDQNGLIKASG